MCVYRRKSDSVFKVLNILSYVMIFTMMLYFIEVLFIHKFTYLTQTTLQMICLTLLGTIYITGIIRNKYFNKQVIQERNNLLKIKRLEEHLQHKEEKFYQIYNNSPDMIAIIQKDGYIITDINETAVKILGYQKSEVIGYNILETPVIYEDDKPLLKEKLEYAFNHPTEIVQCKIRKISKHGNIFHIFESMFVIKHSGNNSLLMTCKDITDEVKAKNDKECSEEKFRTIIENISDVVFELNEQLNIVFINKNIENILGFSSERMIGNSILKYLLIEQEKLDIQKVLTHRIIDQDTLPHKRIVSVMSANDTVVLLEITTKLFFDVDTNKLIGIYGIAKDVTEDKKKAALKKIKVVERSNLMISKLDKIDKDLRSICI